MRRDWDFSSLEIEECGWARWSLTRRRVLVDQVLAGAVAVVIVDGHRGPVDGELLEVRTAVSVQLGVEIGEDAAL